MFNKTTTIMKNYIITALAVAAILTACNSDDMHEADATSTTTITFSMTGDFQLTAHDFTRSLEADGKTMTDVWVLDYVGGVLQQQVHHALARTWRPPHLFRCFAWGWCYAEHDDACVDVYQCARYFLEGL